MLGLFTRFFNGWALLVGWIVGVPSSAPGWRR